MTRLERLAEALTRILGERMQALVQELGELTLDVRAQDYLEVARQLRDHDELGFEQLIDLCGVDYSGYGGQEVHVGRFAAVSHLLSIRNNWRLRLRVYAQDDHFPVLHTLNEIWPAVSWFEREAFDFFGIMFEGHPDLRRILTDYGFVGHPFRKDFPVSGFMEMTYDKEQGRVVYQPVSIEPRENTPRIVREPSYGGGRG
ncbi:NADH-quinone oxidoreductase subunit C [Uliginosibacterium sp. 31-16]|uniref:NADH-quinone oxidoreductase subunit C n=1 Tax=Uliginosibacterium sp. 31-16 TaxID=3068315 RepID=UPI00273FFE17|nr:NADH-quinone oxidoreductase subunit C [Uliginosibacterium sp. 31-16]MDP5240016.1 NADH-quinone oxidoreductase subunit C [Uliginosibacterium sp. 31-16]